MHNRCQRGRFAVPVAVAGRFARTIRGSSPRSSAWSSRRRWAIPMRPLIWVSKSMEKLAAILTQMGHSISADTVCTELVKLGFSRQSNRKADEGSKHPDRNAQRSRSSPPPPGRTVFAEWRAVKISPGLQIRGGLAALIAAFGASVFRDRFHQNGA